MTLLLREICHHLSVEPPAGAEGLEVAGVNTLDDAGPDELAFLSDSKYLPRLAQTKAGAVLVTSELADETAGVPQVRVPNAAAAADAVLAMMAPPVSRPAAGIDSSARVAPSATLGRDVAIGPYAVVGERCVLGHNTVVHAGVVLHDDVTLGDGCELFSNVVVRERCTIGCRVTIHANSVVGTDGFGYRFDGRQHRKIPHVGTVVIEDDVEIGSCTTIDRGKFAETRIGSGTKIDNLVQIAHNVRIGRLCILCANVGIAGSTIVGDGVIMAGGSGLKDHIKVGDRVTVGAYSGATNDVPAGTTLVGVPGIPQRQFLREQAALRKLPEIAKQIRDLQKRLDAMGK